MERVKCTVCQGTGKQTVSYSEYGSGKPPEISEQTCYWCKGTGTMTPTMKAVYEAYVNMWCSCKEKHGVIFYDDGEHPNLSKHHYRCKKCKRVVQIG